MAFVPREGDVMGLKPPLDRPAVAGPEDLRGALTVRGRHLPGVREDAPQVQEHVRHGGTVEGARGV